MENNFSFMLPIMMGTFGLVFLLLSRIRLRLPSAFAWGVAFGTGALAFSIPLLPMSPEWQALIADFLFYVSFYAYGSGLLIRFDRPRLTVLRCAFVAVCTVADAYVLFHLGSLETELLWVDTTLTVLLAVPVVMVLRDPRHIVDRALVAVAGLVVVDTFVRVIIFDVLIGMSDAIADYNASAYAFFLQISGGVIGLCFALAALGSVLVDIVGRYREAAEHDPLTGLLNRRGFEETLARSRSGEGAVLVCDIDHFKAINDEHGHGTGDEVIVTLARTFETALSAGALAARFGGEEFIGFVPGAGLMAAETMAQRVREAVENADWRRLGLDRRVTVSIGVARPVAADRTIHDAIARADRALYLAKAAGRNQVVLETQVPAPPLRQEQAPVSSGFRSGASA
jgi:diguanylate cyclase (GGDEF)-like protein